MPESSDPYLIPGTNVLRNIPGICDLDELFQFEANASFARHMELREFPTKGKFDSQHLKAVHRALFQDVYDWAGHFRTVNIAKGGHLFGAAAVIEMALHGILEKLPRENFLRGLDRESFAQRCGWYFGEINAIHPFREGNGRSQREFLRQLAFEAGFALDWRRVTRDTMIEASRESFASGDNQSMVAVIRSCTV